MKTFSFTVYALHEGKVIESNGISIQNVMVLIWGLPLICTKHGIMGFFAIIFIAIFPRGVFLLVILHHSCR